MEGRPSEQPYDEAASGMSDCKVKMQSARAEGSEEGSLTRPESLPGPARAIPDDGSDLEPLFQTDGPANLGGDADEPAHLGGDADASEVLTRAGMTELISNLRDDQHSFAVHLQSQWVLFARKKLNPNRHSMATLRTFIRNAGIRVCPD